MRFTMQVPHGRRLAGGLALGAVLLGSTSAAVATTRPATTPTWVTTHDHTGEGRAPDRDRGLE
jgi:hypothetical protein